MAKPTQKTTPRIRNKKAGFRFVLLERIECGIILKGTEVKSLRAGQGSLEEAFARIHNAEIWLLGFHIPHYEHGNVQNHDPIRPRKLLLRKREIMKLEPKLAIKGLTLVPTDVYFNSRGLAKVTLALAKGKTHGDKRQDLKKREAKREMDRALRGR
ncbi:MAG: SsrA-binding protein SmpB [Planctomycetes bacterium]|nr:SsrA-binding protein SmpB [Planctomycetota bacterium]